MIYVLTPPQTNTFQAVLITDGTASYAVFTYRCGLMNWSENPSVIGFKTETYWETNPYSGDDANDIACANSPGSQWSNVLYTLTSMYM